MTIFGRNNNIEVNDQVDHEGEVEVSMETYEGFASDWLNKDQAEKLVIHLEQLFGIDLGRLAERKGA